MAGQLPCTRSPSACCTNSAAPGSVSAASSDQAGSRSLPATPCRPADADHEQQEHQRRRQANLAADQLAQELRGTRRLPGVHPPALAQEARPAMLRVPQHHRQEAPARRATPRPTASASATSGVATAPRATTGRCRSTAAARCICSPAPGRRTGRSPATRPAGHCASSRASAQRQPVQKNSSGVSGVMITAPTPASSVAFSSAAAVRPGARKTPPPVEGWSCEAEQAPGDRVGYPVRTASTLSPRPRAPEPLRGVEQQQRARARLPAGRAIARPARPGRRWRCRRGSTTPPSADGRGNPAPARGKTSSNRLRPAPAARSRRRPGAAKSGRRASASSTAPRRVAVTRIRAGSAMPPARSAPRRPAADAPPGSPARSPRPAPAGAARWPYPRRLRPRRTNARARATSIRCRTKLCTAGSWAMSLHHALVQLQAGERQLQQFGQAWAPPGLTSSIETR